jgi:hypothetical protein
MHTKLPRARILPTSRTTERSCLTAHTGTAPACPAPLSRHPRNGLGQAILALARSKGPDRTSRPMLPISRIGELPTGAFPGLPARQRGVWPDAERDKRERERDKRERERDKRERERDKRERERERDKRERERDKRERERDKRERERDKRERMREG